MAKKTKDGLWIDSAGNEIPAKYVPKHEKRRDAVVEKIFKKAQKLEAAMKKQKAEITEEIKKYIATITSENKIKKDWKGNLSLTGFSGTIQVELDIKDVVQYDERLNMAKGLIDEYLQRKCAANGNDELKTIVHQTFNIDKKGVVNQYMLKRLCKINIKDKTWQQAIKLIKESEQVTNTKEYTVFRYRETSRDKWQTINLNFSSI